MSKRLVTSEFIKKAQKVHGDKYVYNKTEYVDMHTPIIITCPNHGDFTILPKAHIYTKGGCKECQGKIQSKRQIIGQEECIARFKKSHGDKYDYSKVVYKGIKTNVTIICQDHGEFEQMSQKHWTGQGCPKCAQGVRNSSITKGTEYFIKLSKSIHSDKYIYDKVDYISCRHSVTITCPDHGDFDIIAGHHTNNKYGCKKCNPIQESKQEKEVLEFIKSIYSGEVIENDRKILKGKELDIVLPELNVAIEYCGLYWHSEEMGKGKKYHLDKLNKCNEAGYRLITIFSDEWVHKKSIVESKIRSILQMGGEKIFARKCEIREVNTKTKGEFLDRCHIQGRMKSNINIGLYYNNDLVAILTFIKKDEGYDLSRFASSIQVIGGFSKMLKYFIRNYSPSYIYTFADLRYSEGNLYAKNGFDEVYRTSPNYHYFMGNKKYSRQAFMKHKLKDKLEIFDPKRTEVQNMMDNGFSRIFDCGNIKYEMHIA